MSPAEVLGYLLAMTPSRLAALLMLFSLVPVLGSQEQADKDLLDDFSTSLVPS